MVCRQTSGRVWYRAVADEPLASTFVARETGPDGPPKPRLLDRVRWALRARHYSRRTEEAYVSWIRRYILSQGKRHPVEMGATEITGFLTSLAVDGKVAASTQNQAVECLFLYREVLQLDVPWLDGLVRAKRPQHLPVVLTCDEVRAVLERDVSWAAQSTNNHEADTAGHFGQVPRKREVFACVQVKGSESG